MNDETPWVDDPSQSPSRAVIETVAETKAEDPEDLPLLWEVVDPDALDTLIKRGDQVDIKFRYAGCNVWVGGDGWIAVSEPELT